MIVCDDAPALGVIGDGQSPKVMEGSRRVN